MAEGTLFLVVGPSGAGKDSLIAGAAKALAGDPRFVFPSRLLTKSSDFDSGVPRRYRTEYSDGDGA